MEIDEVDEKILAILGDEGRISYTSLGEKVGISDVAVKKRINNLQEKNVISRFTVDINYPKIGRPLHAFLFVKTSPEATDKIEKNLKDDKSVLETYRAIGEYDLIVEAACKDLDELKTLSEREVGNLKGVQEIRTAIITS